MTNLISNYIHKINNYIPPSQQQAPDFDIEEQLSNKSLVKPLKGRGKLIKSHFYNAPAIMAKDFVYDLKALKGAVNGDANDHQLGKLNDVGMKLGGLAIAGYLASKTPAPLGKTMEFVGLGSFFASMAIWPKIALQWPAQIIHGFNVQQEYEDSFGRKKLFYQDPQFLPWDLYSDKEINRIGDRLGVPRNIRNRREFIQEKMKKIAIQNNTLWMLTAGFATPVMSGLICNVLTEPIQKGLHIIKNKHTDSILENFDSHVARNKDYKTIADVNKIIQVNRNQPITPEIIEQLTDALSSGFDEITKSAIGKDINKILNKELYLVNEDTIDSLLPKMRTEFTNNLPVGVTDIIMPSKAELIEAMEEGGFFEEFNNKRGLDGANSAINELVIKRVLNHNKTHKTIKSGKITPDIFNQIKGILTAKADDNVIFKILKSHPSSTLDSNTERILQEVTKILSGLKSNITVLDKFAIRKVGDAQETIAADFWNTTAGKFVTKTLSLTPEEITEAHLDAPFASKMILERFEEIASDDKVYKKVMTELLQEIANLPKDIDHKIINEKAFGKNIKSAYDKQVDDVFESFAMKLQSADYKFGMFNTVNRLLGSHQDGNPRISNGSLKEIQKAMPSDRLISIKSSFFRIINTLDMYRRVATGNPINYPALHEKIPREIKEEIVEFSKLLLISGHPSDYFNKFFYLRTAELDSEDCSNINAENGRVIYKYVQRGVTENKIDIPNDTTFYKEVMHLNYGNDLLKDTKTIFNKISPDLYNEFVKYRYECLEKLGNYEYFAKKGHKAFPESAAVHSTDLYKFNITGTAIDELVRNTCKQKHNTRKWLMMFSKFGGVLLGLTVAAQFFFGHLKEPERIKPAQKKVKK